MVVVVGAVGNRKFYQFYVGNVRGRGDVEDNNRSVIERRRVEKESSLRTAVVEILRPPSAPIEYYYHALMSRGRLHIRQH